MDALFQLDVVKVQAAPPVTLFPLSPMCSASLNRTILFVSNNTTSILVSISSEANAVSTNTIRGCPVLVVVIHVYSHRAAYKA
jgi:hypothetical protein